MPLTIDLSVPPHHKHVRYLRGAGAFRLHPHSPPPHTILTKTFQTIDEALAFLRIIDIKTDSNSAEDTVRAAHDYYVAEEIEVLTTSGTEYTVASLSIEGSFKSANN